MPEAFLNELRNYWTDDVWSRNLAGFAAAWVRSAFRGRRRLPLVDTGATLASFMATGRRLSGAVRAVGDFGVGLMRGTLVERRLVARRTMRFSDDLRLLNDTLANTALADRYSVWGGLLIGWARDGAPLAHDSADADFAVLLEDLGAFENAAQALRGAGFKPLCRFINNEGRVTEYSFARRGAKFEFFLLDRVGG